MRALTVLTLLLLPLLGMAATISPAQQQQLCQAAATDNALGPMMDQLIAKKAFGYDEAGSLLSLACGNSFLLGVLVNQMHSENLEYVVIDLGVNVDAPLITQAGKHFSISQYLTEAAAHKGTPVASFATNYLHEFHDPAFNPNLLARVSAN